MKTASPSSDSSIISKRNVRKQPDFFLLISNSNVTSSFNSVEPNEYLAEMHEQINAHIYFRLHVFEDFEKDLPFCRG